MAFINFHLKFVIDRDFNIQYKIRLVWEVLVKCKEYLIKKRVPNWFTIGWERVFNKKNSELISNWF